MTLKQIYGYNGCRAAGGPWVDTIATDVCQDNFLAIVTNWAEDLQRKVASQRWPGEFAQWGFTHNPRSLFDCKAELPCGSDSIVITEFFGNGESYQLVLCRD